MRWMIFALLFVGCGPTTMEEYQCEGEGLIKELVQCLERVESPSDLKGEVPRLKKKFAELADLMVSASKYQLKHPQEEPPLDPDLDISNSLKAEFVRIYRIEGCREIMEEIQRESLHKISQKI